MSEPKVTAEADAAIANLQAVIQRHVEKAREKGRQEEREAIIAYCDKPVPYGAWKYRQDLAVELARGDHRAKP